MFKTKDITTNSDVVSLDLTQADLAALRAKAKLDQMQCPQCSQPVWVKAGVIDQRRPHFAHKHLGDCPSSHDSAELLHARALLYQWLKSKPKFADGVTLEKRPEGWLLPRPLDAWVDFKGQRFAYWLVDRQMKPDDRKRLMEAAAAVNAKLNTVFLAQMMRRNNAPRGVLNLTTTERDFFLRPCDYDAMHASGSHGSLSYLDEKTGTVTTFRAMRCTEWPQQFSGVEISNPLMSLLVSPTTGAFVHPGEREELQRYQVAQRQASQRRAQERGVPALRRTRIPIGPAGAVTGSASLEPLGHTPRPLGTPMERALRAAEAERRREFIASTLPSLGTENP